MPPKYQMIADELRIHIQAGKYANAQLLPTEYAIAEEYHVSRQTVRQALSILANDGLIERRQGSGSHICHKPAQGQSFVSPNRNIAIITTYISDYIFPSILREAETVLSKNGCTPSLFATQNQVFNERKILATLLDSSVDGILVEGTKTALPNPNLDLYRRLMDRGVPMVFMNGCYSDLGGALSVLDDNYHGSRTLIEYLHKKGHRSIAGIFKSDDIQGHQRYAGYADTLRDLGLPLEDQHLLWYDTDDKATLLADDSDGESLLAAVRGCTAVVCYNDEVARYVVSRMIKCGVRIPEQLAVVSFDNSLYSDMGAVRITSLSHEKWNVGRMAAEMLIRLLRGESCHSELAPWFLIEKESS